MASLELQREYSLRAPGSDYPMGVGRVPGLLGAKKMARKAMERLKNLIWLAAQDVKADLAGRETYEYQKLAELAGVAKSTWTETYLPHWLAMRNCFKRLDSGALISVTRSRSQQKATNLDVNLVKPN